MNPFSKRNDSELIRATAVEGIRSGTPAEAAVHFSRMLTALGECDDLPTLIVIAAGRVEEDKRDGLAEWFCSTRNGLDVAQAALDKMEEGFNR